MLFGFDWKFNLSFLTAIGGIAIPLFLWQADNSAKAISLEVISVTSLDPNPVQRLQGLEVTLEGKSIPKPYLSVLEIRNTGTKPVIASDFETPLEIITTPPVAVLRVEVNESNPSDLQPSLSASETKLLVQPLLLNPEDSIRLSVLTAGEQPTFSARSRVVGITSIPTLNTAHSKSERRNWIRIAAGVVLISIYLVQMTQVISAWRNKFEIQLWSIFTAIISMIGGTILIVSTEINSSTKISDFLIHAAPAVPLGLLMMAIRNRFSR